VRSSTSPWSRPRTWWRRRMPPPRRGTSALTSSCSPRPRTGIRRWSAPCRRWPRPWSTTPTSRTGPTPPRRSPTPLAGPVPAATTPRDTQVSLLSVTGEGQDGVVVQRPDTLGSLMLEAVNARRPPAQRTRDGERVPPAPESPARGDELDGDVIFAVVGGGPRS